jgi:hypothetical protein
MKILFKGQLTQNYSQIIFLRTFRRNSFECQYKTTPIAVVARSMARNAYTHSSTRIVGLNLSRDMMSVFFFLRLSFVYIVALRQAMPAVRSVLTDCLRFIVAY